MSELGGLTNMGIDEDGNIVPLGQDQGYTSNFLPVRKSPEGKFSWAMPGLLSGAIDSAQDPGRALRGEPVDPEKALEFGMNLMGGGLGSSGKAALQAPQPGMMNMIGWHATGRPWAPGQKNFLGEFDDSRMGSAHGQFFGAGHYLAQNRAHAERLYRRAQPEDILDSQGKSLKQYGYRQRLELQKGATGTDFNGIDDPTYEAIEDLVKSSGNFDEAILRARKALHKAELKLQQEGHRAPRAYQEQVEAQTIRLAVLDALKRQGVTHLPAHPGTLYKVHVDDDKVANMLDLDQVWGAQKLGHKTENIDAIVKALRNKKTRFRNYGEDDILDLTGKQLYDGLADTIGANKTSDFFYELGVPGNKHLDAESQLQGYGTRNIIVYKGKDATILGREGEADAMLIHPENKK